MPRQRDRGKKYNLTYREFDLLKSLVKNGKIYRYRSGRAQPVWYPLAPSRTGKDGKIIYNPVVAGYPPHLRGFAERMIKKLNKRIPKLFNVDDATYSISPTNYTIEIVNDQN